jgi:type I restriction enzyme S subunit
MKEGWEIKKLGEVCDFQNGFAFKSNTYKETGLPILRISNIQNQSLELNDLVYFDTKDYKENFDRFRVFKDDLVVAMSGATTGKLGINTTETVFYLNQRVGKFIPKRVLEKQYLYYFLSTKVEESLRIAAGAAQPNLSTEQINNFEIPLPSPPEQQRIVAILDEAFAAIAKAKANAEQNLKNARELFESYLQGVFENKGEGWEEKTVDELCKEVTVGFVGKMANKYKDDGIPFLRSQNIRPHQISLKDVIYIDEEFNKELKKSQLSPGDLAIVRTGYPGTAAVIPKSLSISNCSDIVIVKVGNELNPHFLCYFFNSTFGKKLVLGNLVGAAQKHFNVGAAKRVKIPLPSLNVQQTIVEKLDALSAETKKLEDIYQQKLHDLEELKKSVLQKAFRGELSEPLIVAD